MKWYYIVGDKKTGPVSEEDIQLLASEGVIKSNTLVWNERISVWTPYGDLIASPSGNTVREDKDTTKRDSPNVTGMQAGGSESVCSECGKSFPSDEMISYDESKICSSCKPSFFQKIREGATISIGLIYAGFWIRFGAKFIDGIITGLVNILFSGIGTFASLSFASNAGKAGMSPGFTPVVVFIYFLQIAFGAAYSTFFVGKFGATPGKMACGLKIVSPDGGKVGYGRALGRHFAEMLSAIILAIGYIMAAFDPEKKALHDRICGTRVIRKKTGE